LKFRADGFEAELSVGLIERIEVVIHEFHPAKRVLQVLKIIKRLAGSVTINEMGGIFMVPSDIVSCYTSD
jgi:hypothetical protein